SASSRVTRSDAGRQRGGNKFDRSLQPLLAAGSGFRGLAKADEKPYQRRLPASYPAGSERGRSSGVEHDLAKVGVEGSNPFARSNDLTGLRPDSFVRLHATSTHEVIGNDRPGCNPADLIYDIVDRAPRRAQIVGRIFRVAPGAP